MNPKIEGHTLKKFLEAVERGKVLHQGPFTRQAWKEALFSEMKEFMKEPCQKCDFEGGCFGCNGLQNGQFARFRAEILDAVVIGYRFVQFLDGIVAAGSGENRQDKAISDEKIAMEHDPR